MKRYHEISEISFTEDKLRIKIDGKPYEFLLSEISEKLANASEIEKNKYDISPSGYGIHWLLLDEDLSIDGLLGIKHTPQKIKETVKV